MIYKLRTSYCRRPHRLQEKAAGLVPSVAFLCSNYVMFHYVMLDYTLFYPIRFIRVHYIILCSTCITLYYIRLYSTLPLLDYMLLYYIRFD